MAKYGGLAWLKDIRAGYVNSTVVNSCRMSCIKNESWAKLTVIRDDVNNHGAADDDTSTSSTSRSSRETSTTTLPEFSLNTKKRRRTGQSDLEGECEGEPQQSLSRKKKHPKGG